MFRIIGKTNIDFIRLRKYSFSMSAILLLIGFAALIMIFIGKANFGIDFSGGTEISGWFSQPVSTGQVRAALSREGLGKAVIQTMNLGGDTTGYLIKLKSGAVNISAAEEAQAVSDTTGLVTGLSSADAIANTVIARLDQQFPGNHFNKMYSNITDPSIGRALKSTAAWMVIVVLLGILIYIWIRFDFRFGVAATIATFHDVIVVLGIMFLLGREISILMITALLTLAGYSLTDTVVVFDRIRENLKTFRRKGDFISTVNLSINEVLSRTLMTSITTMIVVVVLYIFGGQVLRDFALTLIFGLIIGTYSSDFIASPIIVVWENRSPKRFK